VRAAEEERKRLEALAEIDRAKTAFFSNVSHEFRTPLTLMIGPIEDLLAKSHTGLSPAGQEPARAGESQRLSPATASQYAAGFFADRSRTDAGYLSGNRSGEFHH
jgi:signal transduction histidine kinase